MSPTSTIQLQDSVTVAGPTVEETSAALLAVAFARAGPRGRKKRAPQPNQHTRRARPYPDPVKVTDDMTEEMREQAKEHNARVAELMQADTRKRNNNSAKRSRIRKLMTIVTLGMRLSQLEKSIESYCREACHWRQLAEDAGVVVPQQDWTSTIPYVPPLLVDDAEDVVELDSVSETREKLRQAIENTDPSSRIQDLGEDFARQARKVYNDAMAELRKEQLAVINTL
jgi:hypothetical protein